MTTTADSWPTWPLIELDVADSSPADAAVSVGRTLRAALQRAEPFAAVIRMPTMPPRQRRLAGAVERIRMVKELRAGLAERCRGLAFVVPAAAQRDNDRVLRSATKIWGCPTLSTDDDATARTWARGRLANAATDPASTAPAVAES